MPRATNSSRRMYNTRDQLNNGTCVCKYSRSYISEAFLRDAHEQVTRQSCGADRVHLEKSAADALFTGREDKYCGKLVPVPRPVLRAPVFLGFIYIYIYIVSNLPARIVP